MEQQKKKDWEENHYGDPNPYSDLPKLNLFTLDLSKTVLGEENTRVSFREFFRIKENAPGEHRFMNEEKVISFLDGIIGSDPDTNYPFCRKEFQQKFKHTFWLLPGVAEVEAMKKILERHPVFSRFKIINASGVGLAKEIIDRVNNEIEKNDYTITLSVDRLTLGVTIPQWTAILYLKGNIATSASTYLQTIFRCQSSAILNGETKRECYVFDFLPLRSLNAITKTFEGNGRQKRDKLKEFLSFTPVISLENGEMVKYDVDKIISELEIMEREPLYRKDKLSEIIERFPELSQLIFTSLNDKRSKLMAISPEGEVIFDNVASTFYEKMVKIFGPEEVMDLGLQIYNGNIISTLEDISLNPGMKKDYKQIIDRLKTGNPTTPICKVDGIDYYLIKQSPTDMKFTRLVKMNSQLKKNYKIFMTPDHTQREGEMKDWLICNA